MVRVAPEGQHGDGEPRPKLTNKILFVLGSMNMIDCINVNLLTPYVVEMVSNFLEKSPEDPEVAHTVGLLIGLYSLCEVCFSVVWGNRIGRKPVLLIGLGGSVIAPIMFGLGTSLPVIFAARALDGFFCGNMGVTRTYLGEIVDETNEAQGFGFLAVCFSLGLFIGPILGGELVYPARIFPSIFADTIFDTHPYLLPNLTYAVFAAVAWVIGALFLEETLPRSQRCKWPWERRAPIGEEEMPQALFLQHSVSSEPGGLRRQISGTDPQGSPAAFQAEESEDSVRAEVSAVESPSRCYPASLLQVIMAYCVLSGFGAAGNQVFILIVSLPRDVDGFAFGPREIGALQNVAAVALMLTQCVIYPKATKRFGFLRVFMFGWVCQNVGYLLFPVYGLFADPKFHVWRYVPQAALALGGGCMYPTAFAFINRAAAGQDRGAVNGW
eukprot:CAMPEP_0115102832 /NCGR_PEP_ID=MMETSP0227-20121206/34162_1 /TAXON_ID=89957 /ORGANISM="Polarella glacialis, Strain CCMP 1383" /LENGTH=439 /DNA_ID=CAMNT_0002499049 /DNA_START=51 /DNA_END=1368 /DNA_ORIENTATION=-